MDLGMLKIIISSFTTGYFNTTSTLSVGFFLPLLSDNFDWMKDFVKVTL